MDMFFNSHYINSMVVVLLVVFILSIVTVFSNKNRANKKILFMLAWFSLSLLFVLAIYNELALYWFNDASNTILSSFEMTIKIIYDTVSIGVLLLALAFVYHLLKFFRRTKQPFSINTYKYMKSMAITANFTVILLVIRTVCIPLFLEICRFFNFFQQGKITNQPQEIFLYAVPYLGLEEIVIILVTIMINMIGFVYYQTVDSKEKTNDLAG